MDFIFAENPACQKLVAKETSKSVIINQRHQFFFPDRLLKGLEVQGYLLKYSGSKSPRVQLLTPCVDTIKYSKKKNKKKQQQQQQQQQQQTKRQVNKVYYSKTHKLALTLPRWCFEVNMSI